MINIKWGAEVFYLGNFTTGPEFLLFNFLKLHDAIDFVQMGHIYLYIKYY